MPRRSWPSVSADPSSKRKNHWQSAVLELRAFAAADARFVYELWNVCWQASARLLKLCCCSWASSSAGRAPRSQRGGRGFESPLVHQILKNLTDFSEFQNLARLAIWSLRGCLLVAWQRKAGSYFFCPSQAPFALLQEFFVHLGHV